MLDIAELAAIYGAGGRADLGRLTATFAGLSRALQHFEEQVENVFLSHQHSAQAKEPDNLLWKGKAAGYTTLNEKLADLLEVAQTSGGPPEEAAERLWIKSIVQGEQRIVSEVLSMPGKLDDPKALLAKLPGSTADAPAIWEHICYLVYALRDQIADAGRRAALVDSLEAKVAMLNELPREVNDLPALLEQCRTADAAAAGELAEQLGGLLADMASSISLPRQPIPPANVREDVDANVDVSAVERAKQRNRVRSEIATQAFENGGRSAPALTWARGEVELNRRRAGLALNRTELGGLALAGTATPVNLPEHIYLELKRAREGAMPALFRDECYRYLNRILEKAKK